MLAITTLMDKCEFGRDGFLSSDELTLLLDLACKSAGVASHRDDCTRLVQCFLCERGFDSRVSVNIKDFLNWI